MTTIRAVGINGSPSGSSRTMSAVRTALDLLASRGAETQLIDLNALPADALLVRGTDEQVQRALEAAGDASVLVMGTPVYRATYSGLLKCFFDLMPADHLRSVVALPIATAAGPAHLLAIDHGIRPLVASLLGVTTSSAIYATHDDFEEDLQPTDALMGRLTAAADDALALAISAATRRS